MLHLPPAHYETSKHNSPNETKDKRKIKQNYPRFEFKLRQVNDSSQSNQETDHSISKKKYIVKKLPTPCQSQSSPAQVGGWSASA
jgi:hypothetical protein